MQTVSKLSGLRQRFAYATINHYSHGGEFFLDFFLSLRKEKNQFAEVPSRSSCCGCCWTFIRSSFVRRRQRWIFGGETGTKNPWGKLIIALATPVLFHMGLFLRLKQEAGFYNNCVSIIFPPSSPIFFRNNLHILSIYLKDRHLPPVPLPSKAGQECCSVGLKSA